MKQNKTAFSLIEILIGMMIFVMGMVSVYAIISSTMNLNSYNKDFIVASSLAREQIELVRNIRDTNFTKIQNYKTLNPSIGYSDTNIFEFGEYYTIQNDFGSTANFTVKVNKKSGFEEGKKDLVKNSDYKLCIDTTDNLYKYCNDISGDKEKTPFYKYIKIEELKDDTGKVVENAIVVVSKVVWNNRGYHEYELKAIFTDYKIF